MAEENDFNQRVKIAQKATLKNLLADLEDRYLTREHIKVRFLNGMNAAKSGEPDVLTLLDLLDAVRENLKTALQFGDFRRAARYFILLQYLCENTGA